MKFILGKKLGMTQMFRENGAVVPVTRVQAGPCVVTQVKTKEKDGVNAVQFGFGEQKIFRLNKAEQGHRKGLPSVRHLREVQTAGEEAQLKRGDMFTVTTFAAGDTIDVVGQSKGKGFQGVVKRHGFAGSPASHGHKDQLRMPGSIGATDAARVFKGTRMAGQMGSEQVTVKNLEIVDVKNEENELWVKGAVPGGRGSLVFIVCKDGEIAIKQDEEKTEKAEEAVTEKAEEKDAAVEAPSADEKTENTEEKQEAAPEKAADAEDTKSANEKTA